MFTVFLKKVVLWCVLCLLSISKLIEHITGSRGEEEQQEETTQAAESTKLKTEVRQYKSKARQRAKKSTEEPTFNTKLSTPIEDIIEETLSEEKLETQSSSSQATSEAPVTKPKKKKRPVQKEKSQNKSDEEDDVGFSFFKPKPVQPKESKKHLETRGEPEGSETNVVDDNVGFSFFQVKEKGRKGKGKSLLEKSNSEEAITAVIAQGITRKSDLSKPSIIDHYKHQDLLVRKRDNTPHVTENSQSFVLVNKVETNITKADLKESKKVTSHISYASVLTNSVPENFIFEEESFEKDYTGKKLTKEVSSSIEVLSQCSEEPDVITELAEEVCENPLASNVFKDLTATETITVSKEFEHTYKSEPTLEDNIEVIEEFVVDEHKNKASNLHFEESIISSITNTVNDSVNYNDNYVQIHFERSQSKEVNENCVNSQKGLIEIGENTTEEFSDLSTIEINQGITPCDFITKHFQESTLPITDEQFISEIFEELIKNEVQQGVSPESNLEVDLEEVQEIIAEKQNYSEQQHKQEPVIEEPFIKKFAYTTGDQSKDSSVNAIPVGVSSTEENQIANIQICEQDQIETSFADMMQIRVLTLNDKEHLESTIFRIEKNFILQFRLGPSLLGRKIRLYCNYPKETNRVLKEFDRGAYQLLGWCQDEGCKNADDTALFAQVKAIISGSFHFYFTYENADTEDRQGSGYFLVDPVLKYGGDEELPLDCIQCQTVLAKQLGPFSTWENKLKVGKESGYNVIHFTPIQELGVSKSCYSLREQLKLNSIFNEENGKNTTFEDVERLIAKMRKEWKVLSICDIVLNHTANESEWIKEHPEATYNCVNCPFLRPAYLLDAAFYQFSMDVKKGYYEDRGIPAEVSTEEHLNAIRYHFKTSVLEPLKLQELFIMDVNKCLEIFLTRARKTPPVGDNTKESLPEITVIQDLEYRRLKSKIDMELALKIFNIYRLDSFDEESRVKRCAEDLKSKLDSLNDVIIKEVTNDLNVAMENVIAGIRYFRVQADGPKVKEITLNNPLIHRYFTDDGSPPSLKEHEETMYSEKGHFLMAHNGWVMNSDPLKNFAAPGTKIYIRRELIAWGDSVKLRYGDKPEDSPFLWEYMRQYVEQTAKIFDGVRLDNCHSTPIPVAEYLLDAARKVRPDLYVVAELFTNSDLTDNIFVNRLGITSLIREAMSAWDSHEEGRLVYRYGGVPVGSFFQPSVRPLVPMVAHALFLDLTHDNPSPVDKRSVFDFLPSTALVNMACCASGSSRGYDELVPHHIHVVDESRQYTEWSESESLSVGNVKFVNEKFGIIAAKRALNDLHFKLGKEGYNQVYVDQMDPDIVAVTRHNPETHVSYVLIAFTAFGHPDIHTGNYQREIMPLRVEGVLDEIVLEASMSHIGAKSGGSRYTKFETFTKDSTWINGLSEYEVSLKQHIQVVQSDVFKEVNSGTDNLFQLNFKNFKPGSVAVVRVSLPDEMKEAVLKVRSLISSFSAKKNTDLKQIISGLTLADLNRALYRCDQEERDEGNGFDAYNIPNLGPMVYCGLQGFMSLLANIRPNNDLGHPFCANLRDGNWLIEYIWKRLKVDEGTKELGQWVEENTKSLHSIPRYLIPSYLDVIVTGMYVSLLEQSYNLMSEFVKCGSTFVRGLSLGSLQFAGYVKSANLPILSPNLAPPKPPTRKNKNGETVQACVTLSAGLPHFSVGYTRNWGRDTFIALRGLLILTGRFEEARQHILGYAACLRHGLIPNLLDGGRNSRFNCRDAVWWWLYCIKSYCEEATNGTAILSDKVSRIFPTDDSTAQLAGAVDQPLYDVMQEALKVHFQGLKFRERNAGRQIDEHMTDAGFNNQIGIHPETGFVFGGNQWNCGTWMDKMGSSDKAGNKGKPATPRDGSAVELVGLSKATVYWLWKLNQEGKYPYDGVKRNHNNGTVTKWTFKEWSDKIQESFEKNFWIGLKPSSDESRPDLVNKKNIYKDSFGASQPWTDFQLRCNFPIAMVAAPEMFDPQHAWAALEEAEKYLLGPLGMRTLDPEDWNYRGDYDNSNDSNDFNTSHGFNYHQGPEWVWPVGFFLRAKLIFASQNGMLKETLASTKVILSRHFTELQTSPWRGLPELTNSKGSYCRDSSRTQAWSMSCILEVLHDLQQIESKQIIVN